MIMCRNKPVTSSRRLCDCDNSKMREEERDRLRRGLSGVQVRVDLLFISKGWSLNPVEGEREGRGVMMWSGQINH
jgi:hypothetical protein